MNPSYFLVRNQEGTTYAKSSLEFTKDYTEAIKLDTVGDAMKLAVEINKIIGNPSFKFYAMYD